MKTILNGNSVEGTFRNMSNNYKTGTKLYSDLLKVKYNNGTTGFICETEIVK